MLTIREKAVISELLEAGVGVTEIARRTGRSVSTIYSLKRRPKAQLTASVPDSQIKPKNRQETYKRSQQVITTPGEQAQVDWGSFGKIAIAGRIEPLYAFVYVLSYSRAIYVEFVVRQNQQTLHSCHEHAFKKLGIPRNIRYDNMKTVVLRRTRLPEGGTRDYITPTFKDFARYYGFNIELCPRYWPRSKGKVEAMVKYLRHNFMGQQAYRKTYKSLEELNDNVARWTESVAQQRNHKTTGRKPFELWQEEKRFLEFPTLPPYNSNPFLVRRSTKDGLVQYKANLYAVPMLFAQKKLTVRELPEHGLAKLEIYYKQQLVARHTVCLERGKWVMDGEYLTTYQGSQVERVDRQMKDSRPQVKVVPRGLSHYNNFIPRRSYGQKKG